MGRADVFGPPEPCRYPAKAEQQPLPGPALRLLDLYLKCGWKSLEDATNHDKSRRDQPNRRQRTALGLSLDKVRVYSRQRGINTLLTHIDDRDRDRNQRSLADVVAGTLDK
jgi:hypothetical protein